MERRSYHPARTTFSRGQQANDGDKRRSTWHPSQTLASKRQLSNEGTNVSPLKRFVNVQQVQNPILSSSQLTSQSITDQILQQNTTSGNDFELGHDDTIYKSTNISMVEDPMESPTSTIELLENSNSCELPIQSTQESTSSQSARNSIASHQMDSSIYTSTPPSMVNSVIPQDRTIQSTRQSTQSFHQVDPSKRSLCQSEVIRSARQSTSHEPIIDVSNSNDRLLQKEAWEDDNTPIQPPYASTRQAKANQYKIRQSSIQNYNSNAKEFEGSNQPHEYRSNHQPITKDHLYDDHRQTFQNKSLYKLIRQSVGNPSIQHSIVDHSTQQSSNSPSTRQSIKNEFMQQSTAGQSACHSTIQSTNDDNQAFNGNNGLPYRLHQSTINPSVEESRADCHTRQSMTNKSMRSFSNSPSRRRSMTYKLNQPSMVMDEDSKMINYEIWPEEVYRQKSSLEPTRQSMPTRSTTQSIANRSARQSAIKKSTRPSTVHGYNMDNQIQNDTSQSNIMPPKSTRQSIATKSMRPSTADDRISYGRILESDNEIPPFKSTRQSTTSIITRESKGHSPSNDLEIFEGNDASLMSRPYVSHQQPATSKSTQQFTASPLIRHSMITRPNRQSVANRLLRQSTGNQSSRQSMTLKLGNQSIVEEYDPREQFLYQEEASLDPLSYQPNQQSMANNFAQQSVSNRYVQHLGIGNSEFGTNGHENDFFFNQSPSKSTQQPFVNRSAQQSQGNKLTQQSTNIKSMRPSANDHQNIKAHIFDNEIPQSQQSTANQSMQQSIEGLNIEPHILEDEIYPKHRSVGETLFQLSHEQSSTRPSIVMNSPHQMLIEDPSIELQTLENDIQSARQSTTNRLTGQSQGDRSTRQSMKIRSIRPSIIEHQTTNIQLFEDETPQSQQSIANRLNQQSMAIRSFQQSPTTNLDVEAQILNNNKHPSQISIEDKSVRQSSANKYAQQSMGFKSAHQSSIANPNLDLHMVDDEPQLIQQPMANRSTQQSQRNKLAQQLEGNKSACQSMVGRSIRQSKIDDPNLQLQTLEDDIQLSRSPYILSRQSMANRSRQLSTEDRLAQQSNGDKFMQVSTSQGIILEPIYFNNENILKEGTLKFVPQSIENMSSRQPIGESLNYQSVMLESKPHMIDPLYKSSHQSINEAQASSRSSFNEYHKNQVNEDEFSKLTSYSRDNFEPETNSEESRLNMESTQNTLPPSRFVTLEVRSNVQKESLDKFLVGGWDSVTLKIPPEMHSYLHDIRNSLSSDNPDLDLEQHMANMAEGNDGQCSANIRILYSGIYNSNQEPTNSDLYDQSPISHTHSGYDSSDYPSCNAEREQGTVRFNIER